MDVKGEIGEGLPDHDQGGRLRSRSISPDQRRNRNTRVNCTKWASLGGLFAPLFPLLCYDITWNEGVIRPITMIAPEGTIVNCARPAPVSVATVGAIQSVNNAACATIGKMLAASEKYAQGGDRGLARQPFRDLHVRHQPARRPIDRHPDRDLRRRRRRAHLRRWRRYRRRDPQSDFAHGERRDDGEHLSDPLPVPPAPGRLRRSRPLSRRHSAAKSRSRRTTRPMAACITWSRARAPSFR